jgi:hypothetical protein
MMQRLRLRALEEAPYRAQERIVALPKKLTDLPHHYDVRKQKSLAKCRPDSEIFGVRHHQFANEFSVV